MRYVLLACILAALVPLAMPKRIGLLVARARHQVELAPGCSVFAPGILDGEDRFMRARRDIYEVQRDGNIAMYDTPLGSFWYPVSAWTLPSLVEITETDPYRFRQTVHPGDVVLDIGANAGAEVRLALSAGAKEVIAVEPEPVILECLRRNLSAEIREKRVTVIPKGALDHDGTATLHLDRANAGAASFIQGSAATLDVPVTTVDQLVYELGLPKVSLIKMHVEGAEEKVLQGAADTIGRFHPRLAISLEHRRDDAQVLTAAALRFWPGYHVSFTPCTKTFNFIHPGAALLAP